MWSEILGLGVFDLSTANGGAYAGSAHCITSRSKAKIPNRPRAAGGPQQAHPPKPPGRLH